MRRALAERYNERLNDQGAFNVENAERNKAREVFVPKVGHITEIRRPVWRARIAHRYQDKSVRGRPAMTPKETIIAQDAFDAHLDAMEVRMAKFGARTELSRPIYKRPPAKGRPFERNDVLDARDIKRYGIKVDIGDALTKASLNRDMPDPNDRVWLAEHGARLLAGESHEEIMKNPPLGRPQSTIPIAVNLTRITRETAQSTIDAISEMSAKNLLAIKDNPVVIIQAIRDLLPWLETMPRPKVSGLAAALVSAYPRGAGTTWYQFGFPWRYLSINDIKQWKDLVRMWSLLVAPAFGADIMRPFEITGIRADAHIKSMYKISPTKELETPKYYKVSAPNRYTLSDLIEEFRWNKSDIMQKAYVLDLTTLEGMPLGLAIQQDYELNMSSGRALTDLYGGITPEDILEHYIVSPKKSPWRLRGVLPEFLEPEAPIIPPQPFAPPVIVEEKEEKEP